MSDFLDNLTESVEEDRRAKEYKRAQEEYKPGWKPHVTHGEAEGEAVTGIMREPTNDERTIIEAWALDPEEWEIIPGTLLCNRWQGMTGKNQGNELVWLYQYKARLRKRTTLNGIDMADLIAEIRTDNLNRPPSMPTDDEMALIVNLADWQVGKAWENPSPNPDSSATEFFIKKVKQMIRDVEERFWELIHSGRNIQYIVVGLLGDMIEQTTGNYKDQEFMVELNRRDQIKVAIRLIKEAVKRWATLVPNVIVVAVGGNHGENRAGGRAHAGDADNDDLLIAEMLADMLGENSDYDHVQFAIPDEDFSVVLDLCGQKVAWTHGHKSRGKGPTSEQKLFNWWKGQMAGKLKIADADILNSGHFQSFCIKDFGPRWVIVSPGMDSGSKWFWDSSGAISKAGTLTYTVGPQESGPMDIQVI